MIDGKIYMDNKNKIHLDCDCCSLEHQQKWDFDPEGNEVWCGVFIKDWQSFWKRLVKGVKYIFRNKSKYGHFDTFILPHKDIPAFIKFLEQAHELQEIEYDRIAEKILEEQKKKPSLPPTRIVREDGKIIR